MSASSVTVAGTTSTLGHAAGPVVAMYMLPQQMPKGRYVATTALLASRRLRTESWRRVFTLAAVMAAAFLMFLVPSGGRNTLRLLNWQQTRDLPWEILILFGGGLSLAAAVSETGLAHWLGSSLVPLGTFGTAALVVGAVVLVIFLFTGSLGATLVPAVVVPVSVVATFMVMGALGYTINTLTLLGLVLAIDLVADDAIMVLENIEKPGNLGAVLRIADGVGADAVLVTGEGTDLLRELQDRVQPFQRFLRHCQQSVRRHRLPG